MAWKHENIYIGGDAYAPKYWPQEIVHYANTYGQDKFLFGTDWPVVDPVRAVRDVRALNFRPEPFQKIMRDNALRIFKLDRKPTAKKRPKTRSLLRRNSLPRHSCRPGCRSIPPRAPKTRSVAAPSSRFGSFRRSAFVLEPYWKRRGMLESLQA